MEKLLLYIIEVIVAENDCTITRAIDGVNGAQWMINMEGRCLFILDIRDLYMIREYIIDNPLCCDKVAELRFENLFDNTLNTLG